MEHGLDSVRALLPGLRPESVTPLGGSHRSRVSRVLADSRSYVVKQFTGAGEGWVRECAALAILPDRVLAPRLIAASPDPPTVVMSDLGPGHSVAEALLGTDPATAAEAVVQWATAIAVLHHATAGSRDAFRAALRSRTADAPVAEVALPSVLDEAVEVLSKHCAELRVVVPAGAWEDLRGLGRRLSGDTGGALTPADACPDNNVHTEDGLALIDFEGAQWRHVAWDLAYLAVPWPSCWCSWRIPAEVAERAFTAYLAVRGSSDAEATRLRRDVAAAAVGWALVSTSWFLPRALADGSPLATPDKPAPTRRAVILHRLDQVRQAADVPATAELAARLYRALLSRWGAVRLPYAPAFEPGVTEPGVTRSGGPAATP